MSYDINLCDPVTMKTIELGHIHQIAGGTQEIGGTRELWLNVTYNYYSHFQRLWPDEGIRMLYGKSGAESIPLLKAGISQLSNDVSENYWESTEGNAKRALCGLLSFAQLRPDGIWQGD